MGTSNSTEEDGRLGPQDWTDNLSMAREHRRRRRRRQRVRGGLSGIVVRAVIVGYLDMFYIWTVHIMKNTNLHITVIILVSVEVHLLFTL